MDKTHDNLEFAFAGESKANRRYLFFADKAEAEGFKQIARLFRAAAEAETVHARNHFRAMQGIKSIQHNLQTAIEGEHHEFMKMYPAFIKQAERDGQEDARFSFELANKVEEIHYGLYKRAMEAFENKQKMEDRPFYVCQGCGNTVEGEAPEKCPICGAPRKMFKLVD